MKPFKIVTAKIQSIDKECAALVKEVEQSIFSQLTKIQSTEKYLKKEFEAQMKVKRETLSRAGGKMAAEEGGIMTICKDPAIVAQQILLVEYERFSSIIPQEFIETFV